MAANTLPAPKSSNRSPIPDAAQLSVAFLWHMHQPYYKDPKTGHFRMPWVRLHGVKDYYDMVALLDRYPRLCMTFNLVPSLIEQIEDYALGGAKDEHLLLTERPAKDLTPAEKERILSDFFNCNPPSMIRPNPRFRQLFEKRGEDEQKFKSRLRHFDTQDFLDLQVWSNLVWIDPIFRSDPLVSHLLKKGRNFSEEDKRRLIQKQREILGKILEKYRRSQEKGQIEVTFSPYFHPILPLLCDMKVARFALPGLPLPQTGFAHPEDAEAQIQEGFRLYQRAFGRRPRGMWPSEGSVSEQIIPLAARLGVEWIATDEEILFRSLRSARQRIPRAVSKDTWALYRPYRMDVQDTRVFIVFRDHTLSDLIGFVYSRWDAEEAASDFVKRLHQIRGAIPEKQLRRALVSIILDGENCWEYYPNDGHDFLTALYFKLSEDKLIRTTTVSGFLENCDDIPRLPHLFAGSWINHNFRIWIGHPEDNLAWDLLKKTRDALVEFERQEAEGPDRQEILKKAWREIYIAEGSDWNWWYGDEHQGPGTEEFDRIYRSHLLYVWELISREPPEELYHPIKSKFVSTFFLPPTGNLKPTIDGERTHFYEWQQAGFFDPLKAGGTMHQVSSVVSGIYFGSDEQNIYFRVDADTSKGQARGEECQFILEILEPSRYRIVLGEKEACLLRRANDKEWEQVTCKLEYSARKIIELAVPIHLLSLGEKKEIWFRLIGERQGKEIGKWPAADVIKFDLPSQKGEPVFWEV